MPKSSIQFVYFDMGNVLLRFDHDLAARQMSDVTGAPINRIRETVFESDLEWRFEAGEITSSEFHEIVSRQTETRADLASLHRAASDIFELNVPIVPVLAGLKVAGHRLGILSNTNEAHWEFVSDGRYAILPRYFEQVALSFAIKAMKPSVEIYRAATELAGVPPQQIFFVDDRAENVAGAKDFGIDAVLYTSASQLARDLHARGVDFNY